MKAVLFLAVILAAPYVSYSQTDSDPLAAHIGVTARATGDSVIVRWGPSNMPVWLGGNASGYVIERASFADPAAFTRLAGVKHWTKEQWQSYFDTHPDVGASDSAIDYVGVAYSLLFDSTTTTLGLANGLDNTKELRDKNASLEMSRSFALIAADRDAAAADGLGLRFVDRTAQRGSTYIYRVYLASTIAPYHADTGSVTIRNTAFDRAQSAQRITPFEGDREIMLSWPTSPKIGSYFVERSEDGGRTYTRLTRYPMLAIRPGPTMPSDSEAYRDTNIVNYRPYNYRITGTTSFADILTIGEIGAMGRDRTPPPTPILSNPVQLSDREIELKWQLSGDREVSNDLTGFRILRGTSDTGAWTPIATNVPRTTLTYIDTKFSDTVHNYYVVEAIDTAGNVSRSFAAYVPLRDTTPPAKPEWISGIMDTNGIVTLTLKGNHERDLMGYRLLRANAPDHEFSAVYESYASAIDRGVDDEASRNTEYHDTVSINSLTPNVFYRAIALDRNFNESEPSAILSIPRPDHIPPVPPVITGTIVTDSSVTLEFVPSSSKDVKLHRLLRRIATNESSGGDLSNEAGWQSIAELPAAATTVTDLKVEQGTLYEYSFRAVDSSGNMSRMSYAVTARPYPPSVIEGIRDLSAQATFVNAGTKASDSTRAIHLTWTNPRHPIHHIVIYRQRGEASSSNPPLERYVQLKQPVTEFIDQNLERPLTYTYAIKVVDANGSESRLSDKVFVMFR